MPYQAVIIGGGISGLSAAYYLSKSGIRATLLERRPRVGGVIQTCTIQNCILEEGPDGFMAAKPWAMNLIRELGMADQVMGSNDHSRVTYIVKKGKLVPMPEGLMMMVPTKILPLVETRLLSWGAKIRMGLEFFRQPPQGPLPDRSVYEFLLDHYGEECIDYLAEPLLAGVYGGDPRDMSVNSVLARFVEIEKKYGSLTRGVLAAPRPKSSGGSFLLTLQPGLGALIDALRPSADIVPADVETIERSSGGFRVRANGDWMEADHVVVATTAYDAAPLVRSLQPELAGLLGNIPYTSSVTLSLGYRASTFDHPLQGHGFLVPKKERRFIFGCTWVGNKFDHRVPASMTVLRCFLGGDALGLSDQAIVDGARADLHSIMGLEAEPIFHNVARWPNAMAQYTVGHAQRVQRIEELARAIPGLHLAGNAYYGIGIPDCVRMGQEAAARITAGYKPEPQPA
ncbi:MAG TPA: protoporphyrinogen oxidase [Bryobacteraceae bacterium]|nr:protoporphyrinogen oxidase [Bryobacteraceae bacterium]